MNRRLVSAITATGVALLLATSFSAYAQFGKGRAGGPGMHGMGSDMRCGMMNGMGGRRHTGLAAELKLTPTQKKDLQGIWQSFRQQTRNTRQQMQQKQAELRKLITAENPDRQVIKGKLHEISQLREKMMNIGVDRLLEARKVLTPQQRDIIRKKTAESGMLDKCAGMMMCGPGMGGASGHNMDKGCGMHGQMGR